ncbi:hypothetical protein Glove_107g6 [Diversispora epigaea]|uniref:Uncharacterized protein n=1 Tax=Diversispora epigaea TaxID=1348612 RepID=A0A397J5C7_9GLOM|nr:hypothetical protein Glove_107g6 [Diversispora epigaea]
MFDKCKLCYYRNPEVSIYICNWCFPLFLNLQRYYSEDENASVSKPLVRMSDELKKFRRLWWDQGNLHPKADWDNVKLPYLLAESITYEEYERRGDMFNVHGCWEWCNGKVIIIELPSDPHEICICSISRELMNCCGSVIHTDAEIYGLGSIRTRVGGSGKEADASFSPEKPDVTSPNGRDGKNKPWPNIVIEVAYSETVHHVMDKVQNYWLHPNRAHDVIVVKINPVPPGQVPMRMRAWHFCVSDGRLPNGTVPARNMFEFGTQDEFGNALNIQQGARIISIQLDCLYHDLLPNIQIPRNTLPDPIELDFFFVQRAIFRMV